MKKLFIFLFIGIIGVALGCKTQKSRGDLSPMAKLYHNTTAHYNGYFNADEIMIASEQSLSEQHVDNYNKILPIFKYTEADNPASEAANLDNAIEKVSVVVNLHRQSDWTDDCYLLLGQAQYMKQDYETAEETFEYMEAEFSPEGKKKRNKKMREANKKGDKKAREKERGTKKKEQAKKRKDSKKEKEKNAKQKRKEYNKKVKARKKAKKKKKKGKPVPKTEKPKTTPKTEAPKKEEKKSEEEEEEEEEVAEKDPDNYFMKHRPAYQEGVLWLARTYIERENWVMAQRFINQLQEDPKTFEDVRRDLAVVQAYWYTEQKLYEEALPHLRKSIDLGKDKEKKARYAFIMAQIHQKMGNWTEAFAGYQEVVKYRPSVDMDFSARLKIVQGKYLNGKSTAAQALKNFDKMLKEDKNKNYKDQIYFSQAQIALETKDIPAARKYLEQSVASASSNAQNKAEAYYLLAKLYFEDDLYVSAKNYFDSTMNIMAKTDERFLEVERYAANLTDIAKNITEIELQDSLLVMGALSPEAKQAKALEMKKKEEEERRKKLLAQQKAQNTITPVAGSGTTNARAGTKASSFFAYDDRAVKRGFREFERDWGTRPLEDNWRRSNRSDVGGTDKSETVDIESLEVTDEDIARYFKDAPSTDEEIAATNKKIEEALFDLGRLYRDKLEDNAKSAETLEELLRRYPQTEFEPDALYFLYLAYTDMGKNSLASTVKQKLIDKYPTTTYARILLDPSYAKETLDKEMQLNRFYDRIYADFESGNYQKVKVQLDEVPNKFGASNSLSPRFALLSAMTIGNLQGKEAYIVALKDIIAKYPKEPETKRAKEILRLLGVKTSTGPGGAVDSGESPFKLENDKQHYMVVVFKEDIKLSDAKVAVSNYNTKYHKLDKLRISNIYLGGTDAKTPLIVIRRFDNKEKAMEYYNNVGKNKADFLDGFEYDIYPVTQGNYREILKSKKIDGYPEFFDFNYLD